MKALSDAGVEGALGFCRFHQTENPFLSLAANCQFSSFPETTRWMMIRRVSRLAVASLLVITSMYVPCYAKPPLDDSVLGSFPELDEARISDDGKYITYLNVNVAASTQTLVIQAVDFAWKKEVAEGTGAYLSPDNRHVVYQHDDSVCLLKLGTEQQHCIDKVQTVKHPASEASPWLAYTLAHAAGLLVLRNVSSGQERRYRDVKDFSFDAEGTALLLKSATTQTGPEGDVLRWITLASGAERVIWSGAKDAAKAVVFDRSGKQLAFIVQAMQGAETSNSVWYYKEGSARAIQKVTNRTAGMKPGRAIADIAPEFNGIGQVLFFQLQKPASATPPKAAEDAVKVDVWGYKDRVIQAAQLVKPHEESTLVGMAAIPINGKAVTWTANDDEIASTYKLEGSWLHVNQLQLGDETWWPGFYQQRHQLVALEAGDRWPLPNDASDVFLSSGRYAVYFDSSNGRYMGCNVSNGKIQDISPSPLPFLFAEPTSVFDAPEFSHKAMAQLAGVIGWMSDRTHILVSDNYDIWRLDASGATPAVNMTNGYGRAHHLYLDVAQELPAGNVLDSGDSLLLVAFDTVTKENGFFRMPLSKAQDPQVLTMGPYTYWHHRLAGFPDENEVEAGMRPVKARNADRWLLMRQTASEFPNLYVTSDFKTMKPITQIDPYNNYNRWSSELVHWTLPDGRGEDGILYKPADFDPSKKYPVIFMYYELLAHKLFDFIVPKWSVAEIDIPWYVSHGYLVFTPDIHYRLGHPGDSAADTVISAAKHLATRPYVDGARMGLNGHSFGGFETNYIVTHTDLFAAAMEAAGTADDVSYYGSVTTGLITVGSPQGYEEIMQGRMGATLYERPDLYIEKSPVFRLAQVTTPLLMMNNSHDLLVPWAQGLEMYMGLRRLQKKVWMVQYDEGTHNVRDGRDAKDWTIRTQQFFDHYLKGAPPPKWMTEGVPARLKGIETGLELDMSGAVP